jgi:hypothetical protein
VEQRQSLKTTQDATALRMLVIDINDLNPNRKGRVYVQGILTGDTTVNLLGAGLQAGAKGLQRDHLLRGQACAR